MALGEKGRGRWVRDACFAWSYWLPRVVAFVLLIAAVLFVGRDDVAIQVAGLTLLLAVVWLRYRAGSLVRRAFLLAALALFTVVATGGLPWPWLAPLGVVVLALVAYRQLGSTRPRSLGVPRPESVLEKQSPVSRTDDDAVVLVDTLDALWGSTRPGGPRGGRRAVHGHGSGASGVLRPELPDEASIALFETAAGANDQRTPLAAVVRFSNMSGALVRDDSLRAPRGMAIRLTMPAGGDAGMDLVLADGRRFPVSTRDDFVSFLQRYGRWMRYLPFWVFDRTSLIALKALVPIRRPVSYVTRRYYGVNTFLWHDEHVRYLAIPCNGSDSRLRSGDRRWRLDRDLRDRLQHDSVEFELRLVRGRGLPGRVQLDARRAWPRLMPSWRLGTLTLDQYLEPARVDVIGFDPFRLPAGVAPSADEILSARRAAYPESRLRRCPI